MQPNQQFQHYENQTPTPNQQYISRNSHKNKSLKSLLVIVGFTLVLIATLIFAFWAYFSMLDYKNNSDKKSDKAVEIATKIESSRKDKEFAEKEKEPLTTYSGPTTFGSLEISYPKTWSAYVIESDKSSTPVDAYFHPKFVPGVNTGTLFALRVQVSSQSYEQEIKKFEGKIKNGKSTLTAYSPKNVPSTVGSRVDGDINTAPNGSAVLLPLRDKTIIISTESQDFMNDFNSFVLEYLKFVE